MLKMAEASLGLVAAQSAGREVEGLNLDGIGYREQELQIAKGTNFASESPTGISAASFGGGTHIFIKGRGLNEDAEKNAIMVYSHDKKVSFLSTPLTEDDVFNSQPKLGAIAYRFPSISELFQGIPVEQFDKYYYMSFTISVVAQAKLGPIHLKCRNENNCKFRMHRGYTPIIYFITPRVTYVDSTIEIRFDPKSTMNLIKDLESDELPFINTKVGNNLIDFEGSVRSTTDYSNNKRVNARGIVGESPISKSQDISM